MLCHVTMITWQVSFTTRGGHVFTGRHAIVTGTPVALNAHISWEPPLPEGTRAMLASARIGG